MVYPAARRRFLIALCVGLVQASSAQDGPKLLRERNAADRPSLMVLGTAHFSNPGRDIVNETIDDVLAPARQREIAVVLERLAVFRPTHIAVEWPRRNQGALDLRYAAYQAGGYTLTRNEIDQLGLRLAAELKHEKVFAVDWNDGGPGGERLYNWPTYGRQHGQQDLVRAVLDPSRTLGTNPLGTQTIDMWLIALNRAESLAAGHRNYFDIARVGDDAMQPGANWVGHWYARNLRILNNLAALADRPSDRVLAIYGAGHAYLLRQFAVESGAFKLVEVESVLAIKK